MIRCYARVSSKGQEKYGNGLESQVAELKQAEKNSILTLIQELLVQDLTLINFWKSWNLTIR